ncbi:MAG: SDR family oxidoreductase [Candidatus Diapherotrites archaeon]|nr:SDR family oxidoreductase [Candidatus Diapherotrites archaeon]
MSVQASVFSARWALVTGASSGIGLEFARQLAAEKANLVLVGRSKGALASLASSLSGRDGVQVEVIEADLAEPTASKNIVNQLQKKRISVDILINCAGFGDFGFFVESDWKRQFDMLQVNIVALMELTHLLLPSMVSQKRGWILNVASTAAFQSGPLMAVYYASKSFVLSFSQAIANEVQDSGVTVTALCPGPTKTGFQKAAHLDVKDPIRGLRMASAESVAKAGLKGLRAGHTVVIPGTRNRVLAYVARVLPSDFTANYVRGLQEKRR